MNLFNYFQFTFFGVIISYFTNSFIATYPDAIFQNQIFDIVLRKIEVSSPQKELNTLKSEILFAKAKALEAERDEVRKSGPWMTFAGSGFQISIVLLSASILAVAPALFTASVIVGALSALLMSQGIWLWLPLSI